MGGFATLHNQYSKNPNTSIEKNSDPWVLRELSELMGTILPELLKFQQQVLPKFGTTTPLTSITEFRIKDIFQPMFLPNPIYPKRV